MTAGLLLAFLGVYAALGGLFAAAFVTAGARRLDPAVKDAGWMFRALILPGSAALWPLLLWKWWRASK